MNPSGNSIAELIKDSAYCLAGLPIFEALHSLAFISSLAPVLESKAVAALITGCFLFGARLLEGRLSNHWRRRALAAEERLKQVEKENDQ